MVIFPTSKQPLMRIGIIAIIGDRDLVLHLHGFAGLVTQIKDGNIPYNELFNIGGDTTVRGYVFGQISPKFAGDPVGGKKALFVNAELIFPIMPDMTIKGVFFYDGGSGWGNPYTCCIAAECDAITFG